jgi:hypothetical protein
MRLDVGEDEDVGEGEGEGAVVRKPREAGTKSGGGVVVTVLEVVRMK